MSHGRSDQEYIQKTRNVARFFTESRHVAWVLLFATLLWGLYSYDRMPQRKDPDIPVRQAMAVIPWPGASAEKIEQLVTRRVEEKMAENASVEKIESTSQTGVSLVYVTLTEKIAETGKEFDDIKLKLDSLQDLPQGAGPIQFIKDFGDTTALMLTVASPKVETTRIAIRSQEIRRAIEQARSKAPTSQERVALVVCFPQTLQPGPLIRKMDLFIRYARTAGWMKEVHSLQGSGFMGVDAVIQATDNQILEFLDRFIRERLRLSEFHPDVWTPIVIRHPNETEKKLMAVAGEKYSYAELDRFTGLIRRTLQTIPQVSKISLVGLLKERIYLDYSQQRLAAYGLKLSNLDDILGARNITLPGGVLEAGSRNLTIDPSGEFKGEREIGQVVVASSETGQPVTLGDLAEISRDYETFPSLLTFYTWKDNQGKWQRTRAITMAIQMRPGEKIDQFGRAVDQALAGLELQIPTDLILARTSNQPLQVKESVDLFMKSLYEAIFLVVLVALIGFREWRSALLMATSIPLTLAMTFGLMHLLGIDLQQVSIASLIIALGLLVDDPVVAGDAIKRELGNGHPPLIAAWLGPTKLATAILFATITNIVAYLPLLTLSGDTRLFLYSLPVVLTCSLVASRIVSMTFIPL
ncbi:MAG: efflux RND transporter permease subunit, partial [Pseudomonadota bacterium]